MIKNNNIIFLLIILEVIIFINCYTYTTIPECVSEYKYECDKYYQSYFPSKTYCIIK